jgi:hypothetical protein
MTTYTPDLPLETRLVIEGIAKHGLSFADACRIYDTPDDEIRTGVEQSTTVTPTTDRQRALIAAFAAESRRRGL